MIIYYCNNNTLKYKKVLIRALSEPLLSNFLYLTAQTRRKVLRIFSLSGFQFQIWFSVQGASVP